MFPCLIKGHKYLYIYIIKNPRALAGLVSGSVVAHGAAGSLVACGAGSPVRGMLDCGWMGNGFADELVHIYIYIYIYFAFMSIY